MGSEMCIRDSIYMIPLSQNRPENWEFYFRRSKHYGCYMADGETTEGIAPVYDADNLAEFPSVGEAPEPCP